MAADNKKMAADCFRRGTEAMQKENWDYAIQMFMQCVRMVPDNLLFRQTLRGCEKKKYGNNKSGAKMSGMKLMGPRGRIKKGQLKKEWHLVDQACEEGLAINPWDSQLNADLGAACIHREFKEIAVYSYECAVEGDSNNKLLLQQLAELYESRGDYKVAVDVWERICRIDPNDGAARMRANQAATKQVIDRGGYEGADDTKGVMAPHEIAKRLNISQSGTADGPGQSDEADLQRALRKEPDNKDHYLRLGDFYKRNGKFDEAGQMLEKAVELSGGDANIREQVEDVGLDKMRKNIDIAKSRVDGSNEAKQQIKDLEKELRLREMEMLRGRVDRYPGDLRIKFRLAECFKEEGKFAEAIPLLQQASRDSRLEPRCLALLGLCFIQEKKYPLAKRQFEKAVPKIDVHDQEELFLEVHYWLGRLCESAKDLEAAEEHYGEVLAVQYEYRDTLKRLESLQGG
ncbi:MAG: tetratricopeptide repeat protein [Rhodopirellula sp.]|nr:tetratricopeptide repeat protein [Rhodopirellula sp.]